MLKTCSVVSLVNVEKLVAITQGILNLWQRDKKDILLILAEFVVQINIWNIFIV